MGAVEVNQKARPDKRARKIYVLVNTTLECLSRNHCNKVTITYGRITHKFLFAELKFNYYLLVDESFALHPIFRKEFGLLVGRYHDMATLTYFHLFNMIVEIVLDFFSRMLKK